MTTQIGPFKNNVRTRWVPVMSDKLRADFEKLAKDLNLDERARLNAVESRPATEEVELDTPQKEMLAQVEASGNTLKQFLAAVHGEAAEKIEARTPKVLNPADIVSDARLGLLKIELERTEHLVRLRKAERAAHSQLMAFKDRHQVSQSARYASSWFLPASVLVAVTMAETAVNMVTFSAAGGGLVTGALTAFIASGANVGAGFLTGCYGVRLLTHSRRVRRWLGAAATGSGVATGLFINLVLAQYREALQRQADADAGQLIAKSVDAHALGSMSAYSWLLLALGLIAFLVALVKGAGGPHGFTDKYFGYTHIDRPHRDAEHAYETAKHEFIQALTAAAEEARRNIRESVKAHDAPVREAKEIAEQATQRSSEVQDSLLEWQDMGHTLLARYRDRNKLIRATAAPAYFNEFPDLRAVAEGCPDGGRLTTMAENAWETHTFNKEAAARSDSEIAVLLHDQLQNFINKIEDIDLRVQDERERDKRAHLPSAERRGA